jgi:acyl-CoA synthetase (AMP-forming)/AMP-acid ligase II
MLGMLFAGGKGESADLARLQTVVYGASPMPRPLIEHALDAWARRTAPGAIGEVRVKAPFTMAGYYNAPELAAASLTGDGWIRTRDLVRFDDRGYLHLVDRSSDMIITGGYNVYPREVEDALASHPSVAHCAVVGAPDPTWVEAVTAFVVLRPGGGGFRSGPARPCARPAGRLQGAQDRALRRDHSALAGRKDLPPGPA